MTRMFVERRTANRPLDAELGEVCKTLTAAALQAHTTATALPDSARPVIDRVAKAPSVSGVTRWSFAGAGLGASETVRRDPVLGHKTEFFQLFSAGEDGDNSSTVGSDITSWCQVLVSKGQSAAPRPEAAAAAEPGTGAPIWWCWCCGQAHSSLCTGQ